jgi:DNA helicase HerA-like ATPase
MEHDMDTMKSSLQTATDLTDQLEEIQQKLKQLVPQSPIAYSVNGKDFGYETSLPVPLMVGSYVTIATEDGREYLGQITTQDVLVKEGPEYGLGLGGEALAFVVKMTTSSQLKDRLRVWYIQGVGKLLGRLNKDDFAPTTDEDIFQEAGISRATDEAVAQYFSSIVGKYAALEVGKVLHTEGQARVLLRANGFDRHTFLCGQSGSGKTFALGVIIEQILLKTNLKILIIDPDSDFTRLDQLRSVEDVNRTRSVTMPEELYRSIKKRYEEIRPFFRIMTSKGQTQDASSSLRIRFSDLEPHEQEAILRLDPLDDREECHLFWKTIHDLVQLGDYSFADVYAAIEHRGSFDGKAYQIKQRIDNLRIAGWDIWCPAKGPSLVDELGGNWRCMIIDIGALSPPQNSIIAMAVLGHFWRNREKKEPVLIVIDEAHHVCPQHPLSAFDAMSAEHAVRIAGEGRKFAIYLLLATQRPEKVHSNVVSECDNLVLMRMNSSKDLNYIAESFSQVPPPLLGQSPGFSQGEALLSGKIVSGEAFAKFEGRLSYEGGSDVPTTWAEQRYLGGERHAVSNGLTTANRKCEA